MGMHTKKCGFFPLNLTVAITKQLIKFSSSHKERATQKTLESGSTSLKEGKRIIKPMKRENKRNKK